MKAKNLFFGLIIVTGFFSCAPEINFEEEITQSNNLVKKLNEPGGGSAMDGQQPKKTNNTVINGLFVYVNDSVFSNTGKLIGCTLEYLTVSNQTKETQKLQIIIDAKYGGKYYKQINNNFIVNIGQIYKIEFFNFVLDLEDLDTVEITVYTGESHIKLFNWKKQIS